MTSQGRMEGKGHDDTTRDDNRIATYVNLRGGLEGIGRFSRAKLDKLEYVVVEVEGVVDDGACLLMVGGIGSRIEGLGRKARVELSPDRGRVEVHQLLSVQNTTREYCGEGCLQGLDQGSCVWHRLNLTCLLLAILKEGKASTRQLVLLHQLRVADIGGRVVAQIRLHTAKLLVILA